MQTCSAIVNEILKNVGIDAEQTFKCRWPNQVITRKYLERQCKMAMSAIAVFMERSHSLSKISKKGTHSTVAKHYSNSACLFYIEKGTGVYYKIHVILHANMNWQLFNLFY